MNYYKDCLFVKSKPPDGQGGCVRVLIDVELCQEFLGDIGAQEFDAAKKRETIPLFFLTLLTLGKV